MKLCSLCFLEAFSVCVTGIVDWASMVVPEGSGMLIHTHTGLQLSIWQWIVLRN